MGGSGSLIQKFGPKKLMLAGFISLIGSMLLHATATNIWLFYVGGALLGVGVSFTTTATVSCVVDKWFQKHRGTVMGAILAANGLGGAVAAQIVCPIIYQEGKPFAYQDAYRLVVLILVITAVIVLLLVKEQPSDSGETPIAAAKKIPKGETWAGIEFSVARKKAFFMWRWAVCSSPVLCCRVFTVWQLPT